ncbi:MAG: hypothetical protein QF524_06105 [Planctomycetota bacterium]|jgi:hypothetical protein|nr:hypothetical protein [Planctomycetota bacterium]
MMWIPLLLWLAPQQDAKDFLEKHLALHPTVAQAQAERFRSAATAGAFSEARQAAKAFLELKPGNPVGEHFHIWLDSREPSLAQKAFDDSTAWLESNSNGTPGVDEMKQLQRDLLEYLEQQEILSQAESRAKFLPFLAFAFWAVLLRLGWKKTRDIST